MARRRAGFMQPPAVGTHGARNKGRKGHSRAHKSARSKRAAN